MSRIRLVSMLLLPLMFVVRFAKQLVCWSLIICRLLMRFNEIIVIIVVIRIAKAWLLKL